MTRTDGEHELVLGNKQLLSAFFVVVILLGVFFTMGYFVGKNTATAGFNAGQTAGTTGTRPDAVGKPLDSGTSSPAPAPDSTAAAVDPNASSSSTPPSSTPAVTAPVEAKSAPPSPSVNEFLPPKTETKPEGLVQSTSEELYLQVSAIRRPDADNMVKVLRERGFPALLGESSKQGLFRVLVGPFKTTGEMGRTKSDLKAKGFDSIVAK
jgi:cell division septation protein DedD